METSGLGLHERGVKGGVEKSQCARSCNPNTVRSKANRVRLAGQSISNPPEEKPLLLAVADFHTGRGGRISRFRAPWWSRQDVPRNGGTDRRHAGPREPGRTTDR